eukprot:gnl/MRDRNA2_/MRDRNA2_185053_c0_seq1.p1 gnl/MRDRNA2_/MRDRNA2_185053_c0~~gnl/MRDRNA2_/MRDRNA2_185053_c0_seq1.p1  ORF type:complete len:147 (-),score=9.96 gnl/MRDRNA2_/MRDRNA2_185053_c0_seq1:23-463(-)
MYSCPTAKVGSGVLALACVFGWLGRSRLNSPKSNQMDDSSFKESLGRKSLKIDSHDVATSAVDPGPKFLFGKYQDYDVDQNGFIDYHEALLLARAVGLNVFSPIEKLEKATAVIDTIDRNRDSKISEAEFSAGLPQLNSLTWYMAV